MNEEKVCGVIIGRIRDDLLSLSEDADSLLLPFAPSYRNIDYVISSFLKAGIKNIILLISKKGRVEDYILKNWSETSIEIVDISNFDNELHFFIERLSQLRFERFLVVKGDNPVWIDLEDTKEILFQKDFVLVVRKNKSYRVGFSLGKKEFIYKFLSFINQNRSVFTKNIIDEWFKIQMPEMIEVKNEMFFDIGSLIDYYKFHTDMIENYVVLDSFNASVPLKPSNFANTRAFLDKGSYIKNSIVGNNVELNGHIENSVIFSNVRIDKGAIIRNSLILPGNHIGSNTEINNTIIDEFRDDNTQPNIESHSIIGNGRAIRANTKFPNILNFGVTLLGKDVRIPRGTKIGGNCYINSGTYYVILKNIKKIEDGSFITN
ncbi:MAG: hypothetical protein ACP5QT_07125 [Brevinematia bacterium]